LQRRSFIKSLLILITLYSTLCLSGEGSNGGGARIDLDLGEGSGGGGPAINTILNGDGDTGGGLLNKSSGAGSGGGTI
jgi:hypothetical protein